MYFPILSGIPDQTSEATIVAYTSADPMTMSMPIQQQISALEPELPVYNALTMDQILGKTSASQVSRPIWSWPSPHLSLLLAAVGLYGVLSYLTTQRTPDIGLRIALGAQRSQLLRFVLFEGLRPALIGLILGGAVSAGHATASINALRNPAPRSGGVCGRSYDADGRCCDGLPDSGMEGIAHRSDSGLAN